MDINNESELGFVVIQSYFTAGKYMCIISYTMQSLWASSRRVPESLKLGCASLLGRCDEELCAAHLIPPLAVGFSSQHDLARGQQRVSLQAGAGDHQGGSFGSLALRNHYTELMPC